jgi:hypothetical protein
VQQHRNRQHLRRIPSAIASIIEHHNDREVEDRDKHGEEGQVDESGSLARGPPLSDDTNRGSDNSAQGDSAEEDRSNTNPSSRSISSGFLSSHTQSDPSTSERRRRRRSSSLLSALTLPEYLIPSLLPPDIPTDPVLDSFLRAIHNQETASGPEFLR